MQAIEEFLQDIKDYFYRTLIDPMYIYREILPQSVIEAGFKITINCFNFSHYLIGFLLYKILGSFIFL